MIEDMKSKFIKNISLVLLMAVILVSCAKKLDLFPQNDLTPETTYSSVAGYKSVLAKIYGTLSITGNQGAAEVPMMVVLFVAIIAPCTCQTDLVESNFNRLTPAGAHFGQPGYETDLVYAASLLALCFGGPGPLSVDGWLNRFMGKHRVVGGKSSEVSSA